jgi:hypothetical protein
MRMKKYLALFVFFGLASCQNLSEPEPTPVAVSYFFPQTTGLQYTYSRDEQNVSDTSTYQVVTYGYGEFTRLEKYVDGAKVEGNALYYYKTEPNRAGILQCIISAQSGTGENIIALQGELTIGSTWIANATGEITATVEDHYDFYYLVGREKRYNDVVVVKYVDTREADGTYILRYFANGYGLIHEKRVIGNDVEPTTEVSNLRLLDWKTPGGEIIPRVPDHWWDAQGRYSIAPRPTTEEDF